MNCSQGAKIATHEKGQHDDDGNLEINKPLAVIIPECKKTNGEKEDSQASSLGLVLCHAKEKNQGRNHQNRTAYAQQT